jgi:hypothetical protein
MKYIMLKRKIGGIAQKVPIIFPDFMVHKHIAQAIKNLPGNPYEIENVVWSAGDITFEADSLTTSGSSSTLNISSEPEDAEVIEMYDYFQGLN